MVATAKEDPLPTAASGWMVVVWLFDQGKGGDQESPGDAVCRRSSSRGGRRTLVARKEETGLPVATCLGSDQEEEGKGNRSPVLLSSSPETGGKSPENGRRRLGLPRVFLRRRKGHRREWVFEPDSSCTVTLNCIQPPSKLRDITTKSLP